MKKIIEPTLIFCLGIIFVYSGINNFTQYKNIYYIAGVVCILFSTLWFLKAFFTKDIVVPRSNTGVQTNKTLKSNQWPAEAWLATRVFLIMYFGAILFIGPIALIPLLIIGLFYLAIKGLSVQSSKK